MNDLELLEAQAIDAAINLQWDDAVDLNNQIIKANGANEGAFLRLGFIYLQLKDIPKAKKFYLKALKLQPRNSVALSNIERISVLETSKMSKDLTRSISFDPDLFIETAGKTKTVALVNLGQKSVIAGLTIGAPIELKIKKRRVEVRTPKGDYIGTLPDDVSKRLITFIKAKSLYTTYIKESTLTRVIVFIREEKKGRPVTHYISFPQHPQHKIDESLLSEDGQETAEEEADEHVDQWEKLVNENQPEEKEVLLDIQPEDLSDEEEE
ncbi:hypothetical protein COY90_01370 [Candidatus Roizmanbacteria bacterium CG_4_10_14_0_8_um_filter_39_9]|uniref:Uncharacterized protein n=1 Tax=Candidatus Roizmanbacteria bacterium CG_4_10_14_0_8_um_filter_39_9 TaxID=1974829 RepID=A0A2M7QEH4_9BACT|nr:MAG: hypothetical protein COY90_01370 [Candidatus Roizmanbacteria bacterium CG_4_10_14_0_8_um_filter_39_9]